MDDNDFYVEDDSPEEIEEMKRQAWDTTFRAFGPRESRPRKLDFSQFHPLDHPIWDPYCRSVGNFPTSPKGWKNHRLHFKLWREFVWNTPWPVDTDVPKPPISWRGRLDAITRLLWWHKPS